MFTIDRAEMECDTYVLTQRGLGVRYHFFAEGNQGVPYLEAAATNREVRAESAGFTSKSEGNALSAGLRYLRFLTPTVALDCGVRVSVGSFTRATFNGNSTSIDQSARTVRLNPGISWFPFADQ